MRNFSYADFFYRSTLYIALAVALTAMLGSLYFSEIRHYLPCDLCWYQRILMYPLVMVIAIGLLRQNSDLPYYVLPISLLGQAIATYHYLLEKTNIFAAPTACQEGIPCTTPWINWYGFITIPFLSMTAFFLITIFCLIAMTNGEPQPEEFASAPWFQVGTVITLVVAAFLLIYQFDPLREGDALLLTTISARGDMSPINATDVPIQVSRAITSSAETTSSKAGPEEIALGQQLFVASCAVCHGASAEGVANLGPALTESAIIQQQSAAEALAFIRTGRAVDDPANTTGIMMPPSGGNPGLTDAQILAIVAFLRN